MRSGASCDMTKFFHVGGLSLRPIYAAASAGVHRWAARSRKTHGARGGAKWSRQAKWLDA